MGQSFRIGERWKLEPQLQLVQRLRLDAMALAGAQVQQHRSSGWTARAGLRLKGEYATSAGTVQPYARVNVYRASAGQDVVRFAGPAAITDIASNMGYTTAELAGGLTMTLNPVASVYGEIGKLWALGGDSRVRSGLQGSAACECAGSARRGMRVLKFPSCRTSWRMQTPASPIARHWYLFSDGTTTGMDALIQAIMEGRRPGSEFTLSPRRLGLSREAFHALAVQWEAGQGGDGFTLVYVHRTGDHRLIDLVTLKRNRETMGSPPATLA